MDAQTNALQEMDKLPIRKAVIKNVIPSVLAGLMMLVYNMADKVFIAMTGNDLMVSAVTMATPVFMMFLAVGGIFGTGGVALTSRLTGEGDMKKIDRASSFCCWGGLGTGVVLCTLLLIFMDPVIRILGAQEAETIAFTRDYLKWIAVCCPFAILSHCLSCLVRANGKPNLSMIGSVLGNIFNIVLDPIFILVFDMGTEGAAIATLLGQMFSAVFYLVVIFAKKTTIHIRLRDFSVGDKIAATVFAAGVPSAIYTMMQSVGNILMNSKLGAYGDLAVAGNGAAMNIVSIACILATGIGNGIQPLLGYQIGNHNEKRFHDYLKYALGLTIAVSLIITVACYIFIDPIVGVFVSSPEAIGYGVSFSKIMLTTCWLFCLLGVCSTIIQTTGHFGASLVVTLSRNGYIFIPLLFLMDKAVGMYGIIWTSPISDVICIVIALLVLRHVIRKCFGAATEQPHEEAEEIDAAAAQDTTSYIITIGRSYGAGGRTVGKLVAQRLGIPFYDKEIMETVAKETGLSKAYLERLDESSAIVSASNAIANSGAMSNIYTSDAPIPSAQSIAYQAQKAAVEAIAAKGPCVIVGRRADQFLKDTNPVFSVFISAPLEKRVERVMERERRSDYDVIQKKVKQIDKERKAYYGGSGSQIWGAAESYDLCIDADEFGAEGTAEIILTALKHKSE